MGDATQPVVCHITQTEQAALARLLLRATATNREARESKLAAFAAVEDGGFGLDWVRARLDDPAERTVSSGQAFQAYSEAIEAGEPPPRAMGSAMQAVAKMLDPFYGAHGTSPIQLRLTRKLVAWVLEALDKTQAEGKDDLVIAEFEERLGRARAGDYRQPEAQEETPAPKAKPKK